MEIIKIFKVDTNIKTDNGKNLSINVAATNAITAGYVTTSIQYNGKDIEDSNITSISLRINEEVVNSYYRDTRIDLNPEFDNKIGDENDNID